LFEIGKDYRFTLLVPGGTDWTDETSVWTVAAIDGTLLRLTHQEDQEMILNTASWNFIKAVPVAERSVNIAGFNLKTR
jgi:hypothetical protein